MRDGKNGNINLNMPREQRTQWRNYKNVYFFISGFRIGSQQRQSPVGTMRLNRMNKSIGIYSNNFARGFRDAIHVFSIRCVMCVLCWSLWTNGQFSPFHEIRNLWWSTVCRISILWILNWQLSSRRTVAAEYYLLTSVGWTSRERIKHSMLSALGYILDSWYETRHMRGPRHDIRYVWLEQSISIWISFFHSSHKWLRCAVRDYMWWLKREITTYIIWN